MRHTSLFSASLLHFLAICLAAVLPVAGAHAADWMINEDYFQTDARDATDFEFLLAGDVADRITGGGQSSVTNAFPDPTRSASLQPGFNNTIVRFVGSGGIPNSPTVKRHFGIFGNGAKPTVLTKAWSFPSAPTRVPVPKSNFDFAYDPVSEALRITLENTSPYTVTFQNVGYAINSNELPIEQLTATGLPLSAFLPLPDFAHEYQPGEFFSALIPNVSPQSFAVTHATVFFSGQSSNMDYKSTGDEWAQVRVAAAVAEPGTFALVLVAGLAGLCLWVRRARGRAYVSLLLAAAALTLPVAPATADVWVVPLAAPPVAGDMRPFIDLKAKDTSGNDITIKTLIDGGSTSSELKVTAAVGGQLGVMGGTAGTERSINGPSPMTSGASIPGGAALGFGGSPTSPAGQAAAAPPLPTTATVGMLPPGRQATLGSGYLEANFDASGRIDGYYWFVAKGQGATGGVATANAIASFLAFSAPVVSNPAGRPVGTKSEEVTPLKHPAPQGEEATDGGFILGVDLSGPANTLGGVPFLLKSGFSRTLLATQSAIALGINPSTLPTGQFETNFGVMTVGLVDVDLDLFGDPGFPTFRVEVGVTLNQADNPFGDNVLGSDVLGQLAYWDLDQTNPAAPRFSAAATLTFVAEPASVALLAPMLLALPFAGRRDTRETKRETKRETR